MNEKREQETLEELKQSVIAEMVGVIDSLNRAEYFGGRSSNLIAIGKLRAYQDVLKMMGAKVEIESQYITKTAAYGYVSSAKIDGTNLDITRPMEWAAELPRY